ncbi:hypothetical protein LXH13_24060 [Streptomyces spinosirectus]|jgi:hypothetical protein|uniref:hypothetical protein n=1 Tax=Streptomyces TaxID=1883 RepID=UPI000D397245|nr:MULTISPECIES: hypothetical protein [Streptomyces]MBY8345438.1 hypothetical protein [Streptomyces plumbidurans]PTM97905.1 hypothetical protein C7821_103116 [Streptomyces sp. VMFN-G11Ma]UIR19929.1 hypothetical protein LXH13_24060 [Streptomyces spinosirectus]
MIPAMPATARSSRQASVAALRFGRVAAMGTVAALILIAGVWGSWKTAPYVMLTKGRERGTIQVTRCEGDVCTGPFTPTSPGASGPDRVVIEKSVAVRKGRTYAVVMKPGGDVAVRSGPAGVLYAWVPLGGALLLASVVVAGGLRRTRLAWAMALSGAALLTAAFAAL